MNKELENEIKQITAELKDRHADLQANLLEKIDELALVFRQLKQAEELLGYVKQGGRIQGESGVIIDGSSFAATIHAAKHYLSGEGVGEGNPGWREVNPEEVSELVKQSLKSDRAKARFQGAHQK